MKTTTSSSYPRRSSAGSTIVVGLVIMAIGTIGVTAWVSLIAARSYHVESMATHMQRRVALMNAHSVTREYLYRNVLTKETNTAATVVMPDGTTTITIPVVSETPLASVTRPGGVVRTGPSNGYGYYVEMPISMTISLDDDGDPLTATIDTTHTTDYLLKSRSPVLAGDLVSTYLPTLSWWTDTNLKGDITVYGNTMLWASQSPHGADDAPRTATYSTYTGSDPTTPDKVKNLAGNWFPQRNFASVPRTAGDVGTGNGYEGRLNAIDPGAGTWSLMAKVLASSPIVIDGATAFDSGRGAVSDGSGKVTITLDDIHLTNVLVGNGTNEIEFLGQTNASDYNNAGSRGAIAVLAYQTLLVNDLDDVKFVGENNRRLLFAVKKTGDWGHVHFEFEDAGDDPRWRMVLVSENAYFHREAAQENGTVTMYGGIMTDRDFDWRNDGNRFLHIYRDTDPKFLERLAPRMAWIESYLDQ